MQVTAPNGSPNYDVQMVEGGGFKEEWTRLPVEDRIQFCLLMATGLRKTAETADPSEKEECLKLADNWENLASEVVKSG